MSRSIKHKTILAIGHQKVTRPRELQVKVGSDEHSIVHTVYRLQKDGIADFRTTRNKFSPGRNITDIHLTTHGLEILRELEQDEE